MDREAWCAEAHGFTKTQPRRATELICPHDVTILEDV